MEATIWRQPGEGNNYMLTKTKYAAKAALKIKHPENKETNTTDREDADLQQGNDLSELIIDQPIS